MFPFDNKEHTLIIGDSFRSNRQYDMIRYDFKPKSIDTEKEGILETDDTKCTIRLPHIEAARNIDYKGKRTPDGKECLIIVNHDTGEITLERVNTISNVKNQRGSTGETYDFKTRTRKPLPPKKEIIPKRIEPVVMQSPENKRPPKANRNVPSPVVNKRPKREEERTNEIELPSRIKPYMEQEPSSDMQILGLPSTLTNDPPARPSVPKPAVPTEPPSLFSTSEESESDSDDSSSDSEDETRSSTDDEKENENPTGHSAGPATTYSAGPATTYSAGPATTYTTTTTTNTTGGFPGSLGLDLSDDSDSS